MTFSLNLNEAKEEFKGNYLPYAQDGIYEATLKDVTKKVASTGTIFFEFNFENGDGVQYPKVSRALFKDEIRKFRAYHYAMIMVVLGVSESAAEKAVSVCENKANREAIADAYVQTFNRLAQKHPKVKLEVTTEVNNGKEYARSEFADHRVHFGSSRQVVPKTADVLPDEDEVTVDFDEIPLD